MQTEDTVDSRVSNGGVPLGVTIASDKASVGSSFVPLSSFDSNVLTLDATALLCAERLPAVSPESAPISTTTDSITPRLRSYVSRGDGIEMEHPGIVDHHPNITEHRTGRPTRRKPPPVVNVDVDKNSTGKRRRSVSPGSATAKKGKRQRTCGVCNKFGCRGGSNRLNCPEGTHCGFGECGNERTAEPCQYCKRYFCLSHIDTNREKNKPTSHRCKSLPPKFPKSR